MNVNYHFFKGCVDWMGGGKCWERYFSVPRLKAKNIIYTQ